jgi:helicase
MRMVSTETLPIESLVAHGFSRRVVELWREHGYRELLPLQAEAISRYPVSRGGNLVVFAPTSSGKTFVAEMAAVRQLEQGRKVVYLVPTKALAEEKYRQWVAAYDRLGLRILISTRERPEADARVIAGNYDLLIAVYEKMKSFLVVRPEILGQIGLVVVDELQMLADPLRGAALELVLLKLVGGPKPPQLIALSAVLSDATRLSQWLHSDVLVYRKRPVEIREGVFNCEDGRFHYTCFNTGEEGHEPLLSEAVAPEAFEDQFGRDVFLDIAWRLAKELGEQVLVFVPTRSMSRQWAYQMARRVDFEPVAPAIEELKRFEATHARDLMLECLGRAVAYHNAELNWDMRRLVEHYYNRGDIRVLFSTSTLGQGVNLSGRNVLHVGQMVTSDAWTGEASFVPLTRERFRNQGGRAARFGREAEFGRSILLARNGEEARRLRGVYLAGADDSLPPALAGRNLEGIICDLAASNVTKSRADVARLLESSYTAAILWSAEPARFRRDLDNVVEAAKSKNLLAESADGRLEATGLGRVVAVQGIQPVTAARFARWIGSLGARRAANAEMLLIAALTPDGEECSVPITARDRASRDYRAAVIDLLGEAAESDEFLRLAVNPPGGWTETLLAALKRTLVLHYWIGPTDTETIEEQSGMFSGTIVNLAQQFQWLVQALAGVTEAMGGKRALVAQALRLADRLHYGVEAKCLRLAALKVEAMTRGYLKALVAEGFDTLAAVVEAPPDALQRILPDRVAHELVARARYELEQARPRREADRAGALAPRRKKVGPVGKLSEAVQVDASSQVSKQPPATEIAAPPESAPSPAAASIRLTFDAGQPDRVLVNGTPVTLTPYPYDLLQLLARRAGRVVLYREIDAALWPDAKVEPQQISAHKRAIQRAVAAVAGEQAARGLIETVARRGLRLNLREEEIVWKS